MNDVALFSESEVSNWNNIGYNHAIMIILVELQYNDLYRLDG